MRSCRTLLLVLAPALVACSSSEPPPAPLDAAAIRHAGADGRADGFNLLVVTLDTTRADHVGCYGHETARTPNVDGLALHGVRFADALSPAPITLPAHASLFTGKTPPRHGARNNGTYRLADGHHTLAESLGEAGYDTAAVVGAYVLDSRFGLAQGFDHYDDAISSQARSGQFNERTATEVTDAALAWLARPRESPFFLWVHYFDPHATYRPPPEFADLPAYDGEIAYVDAQLGRIIDHLEAEELLARTLVVLTSDHGEGLGEHGEETHSILVYDSTLRVPLIFSAPALFEGPGVVSDRVAGLVDVTPTVLDLLGVAREAPLDGRNLFSSKPDETRTLYFESLVPFLNHGWAPLTGLRRLHDKLISAPEPEYYDLERDPDELVNSYRSEPRIAALEDELRALREGHEPIDAAAEREAGLSEAEIERLSALGYVRSHGGGARTGSANPMKMIEVYQTLSRADAASSDGHHDRALEMLEPILAGDTTNAAAWDKLSLVRVRLRDYDRAREALNRALDLAPTAERWARLAQLRLAGGDGAGCVEALEAARALDPAEALIDLVDGDRLAMSGDFAGARERFRDALEKDPVRWGEDARAKIDQASRILDRP